MSYKVINHVCSEGDKGDWQAYPLGKCHIYFSYFFFAFCTFLQKSILEKIISSYSTYSFLTLKIRGIRCNKMNLFFLMLEKAIPYTCQSACQAHHASRLLT
jgi:hypothetical protein